MQIRTLVLLAALGIADAYVVGLRAPCATRASTLTAQIQPEPPAGFVWAEDTQPDTAADATDASAVATAVAPMPAAVEPAAVELAAVEPAAVEPAPVPASSGVVEPVKAAKKPKETTEARPKWREGLFAPAVLAAKQVMGEQGLKELRAAVITKHSKVISQFIDTSESKFGQLVLRRMFEYADKDGNGTLDKEEVQAALKDLGFDFMDEKQVNSLMKKADADKNDVIDFEEFVKETPKALRTNLVKLAKKNGHDLGFLV